MSKPMPWRCFAWTQPEEVGLNVSWFSVPKFFSLNLTQTLVVHIYKTFFFFIIFSVFHIFCSVRFCGQQTRKAAADGTIRKGSFSVPKKWWYANHGWWAFYQFSAKGYFANALIVILVAYTIQLQVLTTVIAVCLFWTASQSPCGAANISSPTSLQLSPPLWALCLYAQ